MSEDDFDRWVKSELKRLEAEERREESRKAYEERERIKMERYLNAPSMDLDGNIVGGKSLSDRKTGEH